MAISLQEKSRKIHLKNPKKLNPRVTFLTMRKQCNKAKGGNNHLTVPSFPR